MRRRDLRKRTPPFPARRDAGNTETTAPISEPTPFPSIFTPLRVDLR